MQGTSLSKFTRNDLNTFFKSVKKKKKDKGLEIYASPKFFDYSRILVVTPRKAGSAAKRNRIRRRLKSIFFENKYFQKIAFDIVIVVRKDAINLNFEKLRTLLEEFIQEINVLDQ